MSEEHYPTAVQGAAYRIVFHGVSEDAHAVFVLAEHGFAKSCELIGEDAVAVDLTGAETAHLPPGLYECSVNASFSGQLLAACKLRIAPEGLIELYEGEE